MEAAERKINQVLTEGYRYEIPSYQRPYSWETSHVEQLLDDLWSSYERKSSRDDKPREYFLGSLVMVERSAVRREVVDGQQRLTTLILLLARLRDAMTTDAARAELAGRVVTVNPLADDEEEKEAPRILVRDVDRVFFREHVVNGRPIQAAFRQAIVQESDAPKLRFIENLELIDSFLKERDSKLVTGFANYILSQVSVVVLTAENFGSAYRLFNVLNARGMPLSDADLIKNALFQKLPAQRTNNQDLNAAWGRMEAAIGVDSFNQFFGHHLTSLTAMRPSGSLHEAYEPLIDRGGGPLTFMNSLALSARNYWRIQREANFVGEPLRSIRALKRVATTDWAPALLAFLNKPPKDMDEAEFLNLLERLTYQIWVRRAAVQRRRTIFSNLVAQLRDDASAAQLRGFFRNNADDAEFMKKIADNVYGNNYARAVMLRLEESEQDASVVKTFDDTVTVEHVLPQSLADPYWSKRFSPDQHRQWVNKLGNLTPLSGRKNNLAGNVGFDQKRAIIQERNATVSFDLTKAVVAERDWTPEVIAARQERLLKMARRLWTMQAAVSAARPAA